MDSAFVGRVRYNEGGAHTETHMVAQRRMQLHGGVCSCTEAQTNIPTQLRSRSVKNVAVRTDFRSLTLRKS